MVWQNGLLGTSFPSLSPFSLLPTCESSRSARADRQTNLFERPGCSEGATALNTMCLSPNNGSEIVAGGAQPSMMMVNSSTGAIVRTVCSFPSPLLSFPQALL